MNSRRLLAVLIVIMLVVSVGREEGLQDRLSHLVHSCIYRAAPCKNSAPHLILPELPRRQRHHCSLIWIKV
jgi:hypothetical protein